MWIMSDYIEIRSPYFANLYYNEKMEKISLPSSRETSFWNCGAKKIFLCDKLTKLCNIRFRRIYVIEHFC